MLHCTSRPAGTYTPFTVTVLPGLERSGRSPVEIAVGSPSSGSSASVIRTDVYAASEGFSSRIWKVRL